MGVQGGEVATGAGRDPAAQGRELEGLREVARVKPSPRSCSSSTGPVAPAWIRAARETASTSSTLSMRLRSIETTPGYSSRIRGSTPPTTLVPLPNWNRCRALGPRRSSASGRSPTRRGEGDEVGRVLELAAEAADDVAIGLAERMRDAVVVVVGEQVPEARGPSAAGCSSTAGKEARPPRTAPARRSCSPSGPRTPPAFAAAIARRLRENPLGGAAPGGGAIGP